MDTRLATKELRLQQWADIIRDRKESGLKVDDYCELNNISRNAYYYWLKKLKIAALEASKVTFTELPVPVQHKTKQEVSSEISIQLNDAIIQVRDGASSELLKVVVEVLKNVE